MFFSMKWDFFFLICFMLFYNSCLFFRYFPESTILFAEHFPKSWHKFLSHQLIDANKSMKENLLSRICLLY